MSHQSSINLFIYARLLSAEIYTFFAKSTTIDFRENLKLNLNRGSIERRKKEALFGGWN
jgi:hypothetical protein